MEACEKVLETFEKVLEFWCKLFEKVLTTFEKVLDCPLSACAGPPPKLPEFALSVKSKEAARKKSAHRPDSAQRQIIQSGEVSFGKNEQANPKPMIRDKPQGFLNTLHDFSALLDMSRSKAFVSCFISVSFCLERMLQEFWLSVTFAAYFLFSNHFDELS